MSFSNNSSINNVSSYLNKDEDTSNYSINRLNQMLDKENYKSKIISHYSNSEASKDSSSIDKTSAYYKSKDEILDNINKLLEENQSKDIKLKQQSIYSSQRGKSYVLPSTNINTNEILGMTLELKELKKTNQVMKETIEDLKSKITKQKLEHKEELTKKLNEQKFEYDGTIQRLKDLIENLMNEKKKLNNVIESLNEQLGDIDKANKEKIQNLIALHNEDTEKSKNAWFQAEKIRRKKWEEEKIKEIKELTIKNLEPELEKILKDHKEELFKQEDRLKEDFRRQKEKVISDYEDRISSLKDKFEKEKEVIQDEERKSYIKRLREQNERKKDQHTQEQKKWYQNLQEEIKTLEGLRIKDKAHYEEDLERIEQRHIKDAEEKEKSYQEQINKIKEQYQEKYEIQMKKYKEQLEKEKNSYIEEKDKQYNIMIERMRAELLEEREKNNKH